jgi:hypothetical protein
MLDRCPNQRVEQKVDDIVGQRSTDEKLHREVIKAFRVVLFVGLVGEYPSLREDVPNRASECFKPVTRRGCGPIDDVVEKKMAFIECVASPGELNRAASVPIEEF